MPTSNDPMTRTKLRALLAAATPGPWEGRPDKGSSGLYETLHTQHDGGPGTDSWITRHTLNHSVIRTPDAQLIVAARNMLGPLLDALDEAEEQRDMYKEMYFERHTACAEHRSELRVLRAQTSPDEPVCEDCNRPLSTLCEGCRSMDGPV